MKKPRLTKEFWLTLSKNIKDSIIVFILGVVLIIELAFLLPLTLRKMVDLNRKTAAIKEKIIRIKRDWPHKDEYLNKSIKLRSEADQLRSKAVLPQQVPNLLSFLSSGSKNFNVEIESLNPSKSTDYLSSQYGKFKYLSISVKARGKFHNLSKFLNYLQKSEYFFEIKELDIVSRRPYHAVRIVICGLIEEKEEE